MNEHNALTKRIKRHVTAKRHDFFIITTPGFEAVCSRELTAAMTAIDQIKTTRGGISFRGRVHDCYLANLTLRTANRILMRIGSFKATNFIQLKKHLTNFQWELYLCSDHVPAIHVTTEKSRLYHTQAIQLKLVESIRNRMQVTPFLNPNEAMAENGPHLYVRVVNDRFLISIDSSGDLLYLRGLKRHGGQAPLRETMAAAALQLGDFPNSAPLVDPMCGSGTFALEGAMMLAGIPPGWNRSFGFMAWPCFRLKRWNYIKKNAYHPLTRPAAAAIFASDIDQQACRKLITATQPTPFPDIIDVRCKNFFDLKGTDFQKQTGSSGGLIALNPPYGNRLGTPSEIADLYNHICHKLQKDFQGWRLLLVVPEALSRHSLPIQLSPYRFSHGGLYPTLMVGYIK